MSFGDGFAMAMQYWYYWLLPIGTIALGAFLFLYMRRHRSNTKKVWKLVDAVVWSEHKRRSRIITIPQSEIKDFDSLLPKPYKGKRVYFLEIIQQVGEYGKESSN